MPKTINHTKKSLTVSREDTLFLLASFLICIIFIIFLGSNYFVSDKKVVRRLPVKSTPDEVIENNAMPVIEDLEAADLSEVPQEKIDSLFNNIK